MWGMTDIINWWPTEPDPALKYAACPYKEVYVCVCLENELAVLVCFFLNYIKIWLIYPKKPKDLASPKPSSPMAHTRGG